MQEKVVTGVTNNTRNHCAKDMCDNYSSRMQPPNQIKKL